ncbi:Type II secretion system protein D precursor [Phycisphaerae bacterium RAS1]|nr:Type II secretion system protein D precursor [Phycisphaerae bacterium RAS1]
MSNKDTTASAAPSNLRTTLLVAAAALGALLSPRTLGQAAERPALEIKVTEIPRSGRLINVPVNKGVLVEFSAPLKEVRVANAEIATVSATSPKQVLVSGKSFGTTQLIAWLDGDDQRIFDIAVDLDLERLQASLRQAVPRARVSAAAVLDRVVLTGNVPDAESAQKIMEIAGIYSQQIINHMRVAGVQQVLLRCTVAEVNRSATRQLGFNGWMGGSNLRDVFGVNQLDGINPVNIGAAGSANFLNDIPFVTDQNGLPLTPNPTLSLGFPRMQMQLFIRALRENSLLRVLAEPNLVAISGQEASFLAGGEFPIPVPRGGQNLSITIEYREFGVRLRFTPAVMSENLIRLRVAPEVSEPDFSTAVTLQGFVVPGLTQRRVETVVELGAGQTFAIGGLLSERSRAVSRKVPALGDIPVLGALFSSVEYQSDESELVVLVTPELVEPLNPDQVAYVPGADYIVPNDWELFGLGQIQGENKDEPPSPRTRPAGTWPVRPNPAGQAAGLRGPVGLAGSEEGL